MVMYIKLFPRQVDSEILAILRDRFESCVAYERPDHVERCANILKEYEDTATNWFIKCMLSFILYIIVFSYEL